MKPQYISVRRLCVAAPAGVLALTVCILGTAYLRTADLSVLQYGLTLAAALFLWGLFILSLFTRMLTAFTDELCRTLDGMMDGDKMTEGYELPVAARYEESQLARIMHRLLRLYSVMQQTKHRAELEKSDLQSLLSDISHQTKTPISNLKMINDTLLTRQVGSEKRREFYQASMSQLDKLEFCIQAMVKSSRLETGVITLEKKEAFVADTLAAALNGIQAPAERKGLQIEVACPGELKLSHDSRWTAEAIFNLLDNAVKYTPKGGRITVFTEVWEMYVRIAVCDTGPGIPEKELAAVFKRFTRGEHVHEIDGVGIGLYLAREMITLQGGYIKAESVVGMGSVFSVFLPRQ